MGLLDGLLGSSFDDPKTAGLLTLAANLMASPKPMQGAAQGLLGYQQAIAQGKQQQQRDEMMKLQMAQHQMALEQAKRAQAQQAMQDQFRASIPSPQMQSSIGALAGGGGPTNANAAQIQPVDPNAQLMHGALRAGLVDPVQYITSLHKDATPMVTKAGDVGRDPRTGKVLWQNDDKDKTPESIRAIEAVYGADSPQALQAKQAYITKLTTHQPATTVKVDAGAKFEGAYAQDQGKQYSDMMGSIQKAGFTAPQQIRKLERMMQLLDGVDGGKFAPMGLEVASALNSMGIKVDPKIGNKEAAEALSREMAGGLRQPGTGPMTDKDFDNFLLQIPSLSKSAQGRQQITATMRSALNRDIALSKMARDYERKHGRLDGGFMDEAAQFIAENPVVSAPPGWKVGR